MPFPKNVREEVLVRSRRRCCICHRFAGRNIDVHHIVQEADGGPNTIDNAIALCFTCHAEAGHYNLRHPLGSKYSPDELRKHRDGWWSSFAGQCPESQPLSERVQHAAGDRFHTQAFETYEKEIGTLWSHLANQPGESKIVSFEGKLLATTRVEDINGPTWFELYVLRDGRYLVYSTQVYRGDFQTAHLAGVSAWDEFDPPLTMERLQEEYPALAKAAGLIRVRRFRSG